jgi:hypothetical protein
VKLSASWVLAVVAILGIGGASASQPAKSLPRGFYEVKPVVRGGSAPGKSLGLKQGRFFSYALPEGWRVGEEGQFALTLVAADSKALTVMVGNAGISPNYPPAQYVYERLMSIRPENLRLGEPRRAAPIAGFAYAYEFQVEYSVGGIRCRGIAKLHVAPAYDTAVMAMTAALSQASQWPGYASWLPLVAEQVAATNGAAFGMRGVMAQNLNNSTAYAEAAKQYRDWSKRNWQQVTDDRNASTDRHNTQFREGLGGVQTYSNPYDSKAPLELPTTYQHFWIDEKGAILGTNDASVNPNAGSTGDWRKMPKRQP